MPRSIAVITQELKVKRDTAAKTDAAIDKRTEAKKAQASIIAAERPKISELEILIGTIEKSLKDSKTKKEHRGGLEAQKKKAQADLKPHEAKMDAAHKEYDVCEKLIETLSKSDQPIQASIIKLEKELKTAQDGQVKYGKERTEFRNWYQSEINKMEVHAKVIHDGSVNVEKLLASTEAAAGRNDLDEARNHAKKAEDAAAKVRDALAKFKSARASIAGKKDAGRNLSPTTCDIVAADAQVHAPLNKSILAMFAEEDALKNKTLTAAEDCEEDAAAAAKRAEEGAKTAQNMSTSLGRSLAALQVLNTLIENTATRTWGKNITDEGKGYTRTVTELKADPAGKLDIALKSYEQSSIYVPEIFTRIQQIDARIQTGAKKALNAVPDGMRDELAEPMGKIAKLAADSAKFMHEYTVKKTKTLVELEKVNTAIEALS